MSLNGAADQFQIAIMRQALHEHSVEAGINTGSLAQEGLAKRIMVLFASGKRGLDELKQALRADRAM